MKSIHWFKKKLQGKFSCDLEKGLRSPNTNKALSCLIDIPKLQVWKKNPPTDPSDDIIFLKNESAYGLENRVKVNKTKSIIHPLPMIIKCYILASFVTIQLFLQEIWCKQVFFQHFLFSCNHEFRVTVTKIYSFLFYL